MHEKKADFIEVGTIIAFDAYFNYPGWYLDEFKAFKKYTNSKIKYEYLAYFGRNAQVCENKGDLVVKKIRRLENMNVSDVIRKYSNFIGNYSSGVKSEKTAKEIINDFISVFENKKIILYGAGCVSRDFVLLFDEMNIHITHIVSKNWKEIGEFHGIKIENPAILKTIIDTKEYMLIAACNRKLMPELLEDLRNLKTNFNDMECGHDIHILLQSSWCMKKACQGEKINLKNCYECTCLDNTCKSLCQYLKRINGHETEKETGTEKVEMIGYLLSNVCTLNCKNCCESVPYMSKEQKHFVKGDNVVRDIRKVSAACKFLTLLEFIGGEPFLHQELSYIVTEVLKIKNIGMIHIFTNGTVIPSDELCNILHNSRVTVYLSNYQVSYPDKFREKVKCTVEQLEKYNIQYFFGKKQNWMDFSSYELQCEKEGELIKKYPDCFLHNCNRLMEGKLYVCPHQYAGIKLGKLEEKNVIDIYSFTDEQLAKELEKFKSYLYIEACKYCSMPYYAPTVLSGEQI